MRLAISRAARSVSSSNGIRVPRCHPGPRTHADPPLGEPARGVFESLEKDYTLDIILTYYRDDWHQDHRLVSELTWNTWRSHLVLEYEVPKYDGDLGSPSAFAPLPAAVVDRKVGAERCLLD
jgi:hypothetical protein